jgi:hypothetical protein
LGSSDIIVYNPEKNFAFIEFRQLANLIAIKIKKVLIKAYNSVSQVKQYYTPLRRVYEIIQDKLKDKQINKEIMLQMTVKAINDSAGPDGIVLTLLVFSAYSRLTKIDPPFSLVIKRAEAICAVSKEVHCLYTKRQVKDTLAIHNSLNTKKTLDLPLQSDIHV